MIVNKTTRDSDDTHVYDIDTNNWKPDKEDIVTTDSGQEIEICNWNMRQIMYHLKENLRLIDEVLLEYGITVKDLRRFNPHE